VEQFIQLLNEIWAWVQEYFSSGETFAHLGIVAVLVAVSYYSTKFTTKWIENLCLRHKFLARAEEFLKPLVFPIILLLLMFLTYSGGQLAGKPAPIFSLGVNLLTAWIVIRLFSNVFRNQQMAWFVSVTAFTVAVLNFTGFLQQVIGVLEAASINFGTTKISAYGIIIGILTFILFVWFALLLWRQGDAQLKNMRGVNPSMKVLISKVSKIILVTLAFLIALDTVGIDLTALAVFGGALGVGIGFGLQKVVSNFISGVILLVDRSIKPGDVIQIQDTFGSVNKLAGRYTSVITRDGTEYLIPNEDMVTKAVINWSHTNRIVRRRILVTVSYATDLDKAMAIMTKAAKNNERVLEDPEARTLLKGFGDNGVDLELRMWINDPQNGISNISSEVMIKIWDHFHNAGIEFPFPQRVIHYADKVKKKKPASKQTPTRKK